MAKLNRRNWLKAGAAGAAMLAAETAAPAAKPPAAGPEKDRWLLGINTSTLRGAGLEDKIKAAAEAGYDAIEPWLNELGDWEKSGKNLDDLGKRLRDAGLTVPNVIGLWNAMPATDEEKAKRMDGLKRQLAQAARIGAKHVAAIPPGREDLDLLWAAGRYRDLLDVGREIGVTPAIEFIGFSKGCHTLGQAAAIALEADRPEAAIVADTFHLYRGGSSFMAAKHLKGSLYAVWHVNDVPKAPGQFELRDSDRVYPGDGILPLADLLRDLWASGFRGPLSLELFMRSEREKDPAEVAKTGIRKMREVIAASGVGA